MNEESLGDWWCYESCLWSQVEDQNWTTEFQNIKNEGHRKWNGDFIGSRYQQVTARLTETERYYIVQQNIQQGATHIKL